jgi:hypothetical protein
MKRNEWKFCSRITDVHLNDVVQIGISKMEPNGNFLVEKGRVKFHINKVSWG